MLAEHPSKLDYWGPKVSKWVLLPVLIVAVSLIANGWEEGWANVNKMIGPAPWVDLDGTSWVVVKICFFIGVFETSDLFGDILSGLVKIYKAWRAHGRT
jgi:hypothetical protein